jgi:hypothetical protein
MGQDLIFGFEIPVVLAFVLLVLLLLVVARVLASMRRAAPVRDPRGTAPCDIDQEDAAWRF